jgi:hypothetical protein
MTFTRMGYLLYINKSVVFLNLKVLILRVSEEGLLVKPGTPEERNTGTPEHRNSIIPEHGTPEH